MIKKKIILGSDYENSLRHNWRKKNGTFYTPAVIVDILLENTMKNIDVLSNPFVKVLDPSCGCGYFLVGAYKFLFREFKCNLDKLRIKFKNEVYEIEEGNRMSGNEYWQKDNLCYHILKNCIFGSDIDEKAIEFTRSNLCSFSKEKINVDSNIILCDSLIKWDEDYDKYSKTEYFSYNLLNFWTRRYDYVIGNPPWVSLSRKFKNVIDRKLIKYYIDRYNGSRYLPNLYEYFIKRAIELLEYKGKMGFVIPDRFANNIQYKKFRDYIIKNYNIIYIGFGVKFPGINTDTMLFVIENNHRDDNKIIIDVKDEDRYTINQIRYLDNPNVEFSFNLSDKYKLIKDTIDCNSYRVGDICTTFTGFIGYKDMITTFRKNNFQIEIIKGKNIRKYCVVDNYYYDFSDKNIRGGTKNLEKLKYKNKIVVRKTGRNIIAAIDGRGYVIEQSLYGIITKSKKFPLKYIVGILNSKLMQWYYKNFLSTNYRSLPQLKKYSLDNIPIKLCDGIRKKQIEHLVSIISNCNDMRKEKFIQNKLDDNIFELYGIDKNVKKIIEKSL